MAKAKSTKPSGWQPIEVGTNRNGYDPAPIEVPVTVPPVGGTAPAPKSGDAANQKES